MLAPVPILSERFSEEVAKLTSSVAKTEVMIHRLRRHIEEKMPEDPVSYESIKERIERIIAQRREQRISEIEAYKALLQERENLQHVAAQDDAEWAGSKPHVRAFFNVIEKHLSNGESSNGERAQIRSLAEGIVESLEQEAVIDWVHKEDALATRVIARPA
jgi:type I restriction enzyme R subunit